jgi:NAD+ diphosphatase
VLPALLSPAALAFAFSDAKMIVGGDERTPTIPTQGELAAAGVDGVRHYLGELSGVPCVAIVLSDDFVPPAGWRLAGLRALFFRVPEALVAIGARAFQVVEWDRTHRFCGRCGTPTRDKAGERAKECPACGYVAYPRVSPAMMALVTRGRELLLARAHRFPAGMYSALAGFVEPGETIEDCIRREVKEEVGVDVGELTYFASQSWAFPHSLMIAYTAEYAGGELVPDGEEIADVRWFPADALPQMPPSLSIARRLIDATAARLKGG